MSQRSFLGWSVLVLLVAAALRLVAAGQAPPGLYHDEAFNGLDALDVLQGRLSLYFPANNGREPLFIYLVALTVGMLGKSPLALRLAAFPVGMLTVAATAAAGRALFSRRVGLLAAAVLAVTLWHVHLSRVSFRAVTLPLLIALAVWQAARGWRRLGDTGTRGQGDKETRRQGGWGHWVAAGVLYGLSFYTYTASRFTPAALVAFGVGVWIAHIAHRRSRIADRASRIAHRGSWIAAGRCVLVALFAAFVTLAPLGVYTALHPDVVLGRPEQVSVFSPEINGGDLGGTLGRHTLRALGMFFVRGDRIWRHNVPWRPVFDPLLGAAFVLGLWAALRRARREPAAGFVLVWTAVMLLPTLLAEDAPHFLRAVGVLPMVAFIPALGLDWIVAGMGAEAGVGTLRLRSGHAPTRPSGVAPGRALACILVALVLLFGLASTAWSYFGPYAHDPITGYWFERGSVALAGRINAFLGAGWDGERMVAQGRRGAEEQASRVFLDPRLWDEWPQVRFLISAPEAVTIGLAPTSNLQLPTSTLQPPTSTLHPPTAIFVWPYADWQQAWALLPAPAEVRVEEGPLSQGDRDPQPFVTYLAFFAEPVEPAPPALARFAEGVELLSATVTPLDDGTLRVRLRWRADAPLAEDYAVFLHYLRDGERIAQGDSPPAGGRYPTPVWRAGDVVNDDHWIAGVGAPLAGRDVLRFGLWLPASGDSLPVLDAAGNPAGAWIELPVDGN